MSHIEVIALRPFIYSVDGYTEISVKEKEVFNLPERMFDDLNGARYVRRATIGDGRISLEPSSPPVVTEDTPPAKVANRSTAESREEQLAVEIPDDWKSLKWFALRSLASKVSSDPVNKMEDAVAAIEAELARRNEG